jgi:hypothetical protein
MIRSNHYEAAFEAYLRDRRVGFVVIDEAKRSTLAAVAVKSLDFVVVDAAKLVIDVKGRKFPTGTRGGSTWQNWAEEADVDGLTRWAEHFGSGFRGVLAFVYQIQPPYTLPDTTPDRFAFRNETYLMRAVEVGDYRAHMRPRSKSWGTVHLPTAAFRRLVRPFSDFLRREEFTTESQSGTEEGEILDQARHV